MISTLSAVHDMVFFANQISISRPFSQRGTTTATPSFSIALVTFAQNTTGISRGFGEKDKTFARSLFSNHSILSTPVGFRVILTCLNRTCAVSVEILL
ncbi:Uncharacterised protein [Streptococcus pneumoniae]|nr:Uncharacterised protein [Streptococcus pneumoniae]